MLKERMEKNDIIIKPTGNTVKIFSKTDVENYEMIKNMLLGFAIGDAVGVPVEFKTREELEENPVMEMTGYGTHNMPLGTWSDDTSLTLALMDSLAECGFVNIKDIREKFLMWYEEGKYTATGEVFDIGKTTSEALEKMRTYSEDETTGGKAIEDNGNGGLMRIMPLAFYFHVADICDSEKKETIVNVVSGMTHANEISQKVCNEYIETLLKLMSGQDYRNIIKTNEAIPEKNNGYVETTLKSAYWCICNSSSYKEAILKAINLGNDTDTVAAITGSFAGCIWDIPEDWYYKLLNKKNIYEVLMRFGNKFLGEIN